MIQTSDKSQDVLLFERINSRNGNILVLGSMQSLKPFAVRGLYFVIRCSYFVLTEKHQLLVGQTSEGGLKILIFAGQAT